MAASTFNGSSLISYGPTLPATSTTADGTLFYKTVSDGGGSAGMYLYGFIADTNPNNFGPQVAQGWSQTTSLNSFVRITGDTMTGALSVPGYISVTQTSGAQRFLIGNQDAGGANKPIILNSQNGALTIGTGTSWVGNGGTLSSGLVVNPGLANSGLQWRGSQVWHAANDGNGSGLDADLVRGLVTVGGAATPNTIVARESNGFIYANYFNMTGLKNDPSPIYNICGMRSDDNFIRPFNMSAVASAISTAATGTWNISITGNSATATTANYAATAGTATSATTAGYASTSPFSGLTDLNNSNLAIQTFNNLPVTGMSVSVRPSYFYFMGNTGAQSLKPNQFPYNSISGFDAYSTSDMGNYQVGFTVIGGGTNGSRAMQLTTAWNYNESPPSGLRWRVNDQTGDPLNWGAFRTVWDQGNLTGLSQLANDVGYATNANLGNYLPLAGGNLTGGLTLNNGGLNVANGIIAASGNITSANGGLTVKTGVTITTGGISATGVILTLAGNVTAGGGGNGSTSLCPGDGSRSGYVAFFAANGNRQGYIGYSTGTGTGDTGSLSYVGGSHYFSSTISCAGDVIAYASDARLKKNVSIIPNALAKIKSLGGYEYDWDLDKARKLGFTPSNPHEHGLLAQEVQQVMPDAVAKAAFNSDYLTVKYDRLIALLVAGINEQQEKIDSLTVQLESLLNK